MYKDLSKTSPYTVRFIIPCCFPVYTQYSTHPHWINSCLIPALSSHMEKAGIIIFQIHSIFKIPTCGFRNQLSPKKCVKYKGLIFHKTNQTLIHVYIRKELYILSFIYLFIPVGVF